jgi:hypothetical protein
LLTTAGVPFQFFDCVDGRTQRVPDRIDGARVVRERFNTEGARLPARRRTSCSIA